MLSIAGGLLGIALVPLGRELLASLTPAGLAAATAQAVDGRLLAFMFSLAVATGLIFSLAPALQAGRSSLTDALHAQSRSAVGGGSRLTRDALVILQIGAAVVLLASTGLMIRTLANLRAIEIGFRPERLLTLRTMLPNPKYVDATKRVAFFERAVAGVKALPSVERAAFAFSPPFTTQGNTTWFTIEGIANTPDRVNDAMFRSGTTDYLAMLEAKVIEGRLIDERDGADAPRVVVINETLARRLWPGRDPIGRKLVVPRFEGRGWEVVGVARDSKYLAVFEQPLPHVYFSMRQTPSFMRVIYVRSSAPPDLLGPLVEREIHALDPEVPVADVKTMTDVIQGGVGFVLFKVGTLQAGAMGILGLLLAIVGVYGVVSYGATQRTREMGIRLALGADPGVVRSLVLGQGAGLVVAGIVCGLFLAAGVTRALSRIFFLFGSMDVPTFAVVTALLSAIALVACYLPARRAMRVDPMIALRHE